MELNKRNIRKILGIIIFTIVFAYIINHLELIGIGIKAVGGILTPFIIGAGIAFVLNVPMRAIENAIFKGTAENWKGKRGVSIALTFIALALVIAFVVLLVIPDINDTAKLVKAAAPKFEKNLELQINKLAQENPVIMKVMQTQLHTDHFAFRNLVIQWSNIMEKVIEFLRNSGNRIFTSTIGFASSVIGAIVNFFIGIVFAVYLLAQKEKITIQFKKLFYSVLPVRFADSMIEVLHMTNEAFSKFLTGQCIEALILGAMFFVTMTVFRLPYVLTISVLIAFTALIPVFGSFVGCVVGSVLILVDNPVNALWFIIMFLVLQQIEGNLIYPHVVGNSVGLPSIWVMVAVIVGGDLMGVVGMLAFIPICSVLYVLLSRFAQKQITARHIDAAKLEPIPMEPRNLERYRRNGRQRGASRNRVHEEGSGNHNDMPDEERNTDGTTNDINGSDET